MHVFFSGIGGTGIGPLALIAHQAGFEVSGSDKQASQYIQYLKKHGISDIEIGQTRENIAKVHAAKPIDRYVYSSAVAIENPDAPEFAFCREHAIAMSKRDELINLILQEKNLKLIAVAGTHGKTTTTAMTIWLFRQLGIPVSYSVGAKISFGDMGHYEPGSEYFVYEADEFDRNFLSFHPTLSLITGIDWDHPDIYPTREAYNEAFQQFIRQSDMTFLWLPDQYRLGLQNDNKLGGLDYGDYVGKFHLAGEVNRQNAALVAEGIGALLYGNDMGNVSEFAKMLDTFPGVSRRFEQVVPNLYTDYAHTPPKIRGALQMAHEVAGDNVVVVYEGLHNTRQHFIKDELAHLFDDVKQLYIVPSYLAREDQNLALLSPADLREFLNPAIQVRTEPAGLNDQLAEKIRNHLAAGDLVLCLTAGGGHSLDEWLRKEFAP